MALSNQSAVSDGTLSELDLSIQYMDKSHIHVYINDVAINLTPYSFVWLSDTRIKITPAVANGLTVRVIRKTITDEMWHNFTQGARFSATEMDENFEQLLLLAQEYTEGIYVSDFYTDLDMHLHKITNLADGVNAKDAVTLQQLKDYAYDAGLVSMSGTITAVKGYQSVPAVIGSGNLSNAMNTIHTAIMANVLQNKFRHDSSPVRSIFEFATPALDGVTNDAAALQLALDTAPLGSTITWRGPLLITTPVVNTRRVGIVHESPLDCLIVNVGISNVGFTYDGPAGGINDVRIVMNVYGPANCANNAIKLSRVDRSPHIYLNVYAGTTQHAVMLSGCLINEMAINSSANFVPPYAGMSFQAKHVHCTKALGVAFNDNLVWVNLEGGGEGFIVDNMTSEGNNTLYGCIEGLTSGRPVDMTGCMLPVLRDLHFEANAMAPIFRSCTQPTVGPNVLHSMAGKPIEFTACRQPRIDGYYGEYKFDDACVAPSVGRVLTLSYASQTGEGYYMSAEQREAAVWVGSSDSMYGGAGTASGENLFHNPFVDIWDNGPSVVPAGFITNGAATITQSTAVSYMASVSKSAFVHVTGLGALEGAMMQCKSPYNVGQHGGHYMAATVALLVSGGQPDLIVFGYANGTLYDIGVVSEKNKWVHIRGAVKVNDGQPFIVLVRPWSAAGGYQAGEFYIGGCSIVKGTRPSKFIADHGKRNEHIVDNVTWPPAFIGQRAYVPGTSKWYMAKGTASAADWIILN